MCAKGHFIRKLFFRHTDRHTQPIDCATWPLNRETVCMVDIQLIFVKNVAERAGYQIVIYFHP